MTHRKYLPDRGDWWAIATWRAKMQDLHRMVALKKGWAWK